MNLYLKNIALPLCIILVVMMYDCKKDNPKTSNQISKHDFHDFRDSIVGNYNCIEHFTTVQYLDTGTGLYSVITDSIIGSSQVTVSKLSTDNSSIVVNGTTFSFLYPGQTIKYYTVNSFAIQEYFNYTSGSDSIWFQHYTVFQHLYQEYYYWTGRKQ